MDTFGYGQQDPASSTSQFNMISFLVKQMMAQLSTTKLVKVAKVTAGAAGAGDAPGAAGTVDVVLLVSQIDGNNNATKQGTVYGLPYFRAQGGKNAVVVDPVAGDIGFIVCCDRDISSAKKTKDQANPGSFRKFDPADGIYVGGCLNVAPEQYLVFNDDGVRLADKSGNSVKLTADGLTLTDKSGNVISTTSAGINLTPSSGLPVTVTGTLIVSGDINLTGDFFGPSGGTYTHDLKVGGNVIAGFGAGDQVGLQTHTHHQGNDSHGDVEVPTNAPTAGT